MGTIKLIYTRLPDRVSHFQQELLYEDDEVIVTTQRLKPSTPIVIDGITVMGAHFNAIWFIFANRWYDIGKIYNLENQFTGYYCDIILPMKRSEPHIEITDLFLDVWVSQDGSYQILDADEFESALHNHRIQADLANQARKALQELIIEIESGAFPPEIVIRW